MQGHCQPRVVKIYLNIFWKKNTFMKMTPLKIGISLGKNTFFQF